EIAGGTFYTRTFAVFDERASTKDERCAQQTMGLVGLHILYQPALFGNPEWVWATFEHRSNVPTAGINAYSGRVDHRFRSKPIGDSGMSITSERSDAGCGLLG
ncbi:MAG TPA: hypothetical protein VFG30_02675, partial [Polyangiales bacterium]|nr:hypothetical protein [Polyangiales bacterium]